MMTGGFPLVMTGGTPGVVTLGIPWMVNGGIPGMVTGDAALAECYVTEKVGHEEDDKRYGEEEVATLEVDGTGEHGGCQMCCLECVRCVVSCDVRCASLKYLTSRYAVSERYQV